MSVEYLSDKLEVFEIPSFHNLLDLDLVGMFDDSLIFGESQVPETPLLKHSAIDENGLEKKILVSS